MAVIVDTSVWIDHFRKPNSELVELLKQNQVLVHSAIIGELACGNLPNRKRFIYDLRQLPWCLESSFEETLELLNSSQLWGKRIGWVDAQLLASTKLSNARLYTLDKKLARYAR